MLEPALGEPGQLGGGGLAGFVQGELGDQRGQPLTPIHPTRHHHLRLGELDCTVPEPPWDERERFLADSLFHVHQLRGLAPHLPPRQQDLALHHAARLVRPDIQQVRYPLPAEQAEAQTCGQVASDHPVLNEVEPHVVVAEVEHGREGRDGAGRLAGPRRPELQARVAEVVTGGDEQP